MYLIYIKSFVSISDSIAELIRKQIEINEKEKIKAKERLAICMFLMSDLNDEDHHLENIEENLKKIYDPEYIKKISDFQSSNLRGVTNKDKKKNQWFDHINEQGYWRISTSGKEKIRKYFEKIGIIFIRSNYTEELIEYVEDSNGLIEYIGEKKYRDSRIKVREGQPKFRAELMDAYSQKCCITGEECIPLLEAAHIRGHINKNSNKPSNGLLLRIDFHKLYDKGLLYIDKNYIVHISSKIKNEDYKKYEGVKIKLPNNRSYYPNKELLESKREFFEKLI
ncbi:HNH endonuclease [Paenibacillus sp. AGC30]